MTEQTALPDKEVVAPPPANPWRKLAVEMGPLVIFFLVNWQLGIFYATAAFMVAISISIAYSWMTTRHVAPMVWVTGAMVLVFGGLTLILQDELFIKVKPTIVNLIFATVLFFGLMTNRPILKMLLEAAFPPITEAGWRRLTINWGLFFLFLAALNEVIWRSFSTDFWVAFKVWGVMPITLVFTMTQVPVIMKHSIEESESPAE